MQTRVVGLVVIGASLGGLRAVQAVLEPLPGGFPCPVAVVLHRASNTSGDLIGALQRTTALPVREVEDKEPLAPGSVYVAPADYHLLVESDSFALSTEDRVLNARPSIDVLFESAADAYGPAVVGVILTGMSDDGAKGLARIKARGGLTIVQEPLSAEGRRMPEAALAATDVDHVLPLHEIGAFLVGLSVATRR